MTIKKTRFKKGVILKPDTDALEGIEGEIKVDSSDNIIKSTLGSASRQIVTNDQTQTIENKTIDGTAATGNNTITTDASDITYNNATSALAATTAQAAIDELENEIDLKADSATVTEIDANVNDLITFSGVVENSTDLGTFTGTTITDNTTVKTALQELETAVELKADSTTITEIDANVNDLITLSGVAENSTNLGTFTGTTITNNVTIKTALQELETAHEETNANANDLITLSGVAENSVNLGTFTGATIADGETVKGALQDLETGLETHTGASSGVHGVTGSVVGTTDTQDLSNKTFTDAITLQELGSTPTTPATGDKKLYPKSNGKLYTLDDAGIEQEVGSGGSGFGVNYIENFNAETDTTGWTLYANTTAGDAPDDFGGTPAGVTFTRNTTTPLAGLADFELSKDAVNRQGQGVYYEFTLEDADIAQVLRIVYNYKVSANFADGDIRDYIVASDDDFATILEVIEPSAVELQAVSLPDQRQPAEFQTRSESGLKYRYCIHIASTNASAYDVNFDRIQVGPGLKAFGSVTTDWESFTPNINLTTNLTATAVKRRVGDMVHEKYTFLWSGATDSASLEITPSESVDTSKLENTTLRQNKLIGSAFSHNVGVDAIIGVPSYNGSTSKINIVGGTTGNSTWSNTYPTTIGAGDSISVDVAYPVLGWSSSQQLSEDADTREVYFQGAGNGGGSVTANDTGIDFTEIKDSHGAWSGTSFTAPSSGRYFFEGLVAFTTSIAAGIQTRVNGTLVRLAGFTNQASLIGPMFKVTLDLVKGDAVTFTSDTTATLNNSTLNHYLNINKMQGPSQIAANELIACSYSTNAGATVVDGGTVVYEDEEFDTHGSYNISTGEFTCPASGKYRVTATIGSSATSEIAIGVRQNGTLKAAYLDNGGIANQTVGAYVLVNCLKGDVIEITNETGASRTLTTTASFNVLSIERIGL